MKERPIIFSGPMVRAILEGRKNQTRRVINFPGLEDGQRVIKVARPAGHWWEVWVAAPVDGGRERIVPAEVKCPFDAPGDRLWVKETFAMGITGCPDGVSYRADHRDPLGDGPAHPMKWSSSLFMPRRLSRLTLAITGIRAERLQDISEADAIAEGCPGCRADLPNVHALTWYRGLWDAINGKKAQWASNPWVWVITFRRLP